MKCDKSFRWKFRESTKLYINMYLYVHIVMYYTSSHTLVYGKVTRNGHREVDTETQRHRDIETETEGAHTQVPRT